MTEVALLITAGRGPRECHQAVSLAAMELTKEAERHGIDVSWSSPPDRPRPSILLHLDGKAAAIFAPSWTGTIALVDPSARGRGGRRNFFIAIHPLPEVESAIRIDVGDIRFETMRAGGPGGQHQNVTDSAVRATHLPTGMVAVSRDGRSQHRNKAMAIQRLEALANGLHATAMARSRKDEWLRRIEVERGNPVRTLRSRQAN